jgi:SH3-like domain-containing protein
VPAAQITPTEQPASQGAAEVPQAAPAIQVEAEPTVAPAAEATAPVTESFEPTHQISAGQSVNFRAGPSTADPIVSALPPATPLQYLDEDAPTANPSDGERWMRFRIQNGAEGWVREIDTESYQP